MNALRSRDDPVGAFFRYSVAAVAAFVLAAIISYAFIDFFIPGFESKALLLPLTVVLFIPLVVIAVRIARKSER